MNKIIKINCTGSKLLSINELIDFQKNLKKISNKNLSKLKKSIIELGFTAPIFVWGKKILDGHQRLKAIMSLIKDGYILVNNKLPVVEIRARNEKDARKRLLAISSSYGEFQIEELDSWLEGIDSDVSDIYRFVDKEINRNKIKADEDKNIKLTKKAKSRAGDIYFLGKHKIICGDSFEISVFEKLMENKRGDISFCDPPIPKKNCLQEFTKDCKKLAGSEEPVHLCFMTDPYNKLESELRLTRECLKIALKYNIKISILTKSKTVLNDLDVIKEFKENIKVGFTLTFCDEQISAEWEPGASLPSERLEALKILKENNIKTWASLEPVIIPDESLDIIYSSLDYVDVYKIGKINNYKKIDKTINWNYFLSRVVNILRGCEKSFYVKHDLRVAANAVKLYGNEILMDEFN